MEVQIEGSLGTKNAKRKKILKSNKDKTKINISFWYLGIDKNGYREKKREEKGRRRRRRGEEKEEEKKIKGIEFVKFCMAKYGFLYTSMDAMVCMEKSNHKPIFLMNLGLKEPYLVYWWCLAVLD